MKVTPWTTVQTEMDPATLESKARCFDTLIEALGRATGQVVDHEPQPITAALLDKVQELQELRHRLQRAEAVVYAAENSTSRRLSSMAKAYRRDYPTDVSRLAWPASPPVATDAPAGKENTDG